MAKTTAGTSISGCASAWLGRLYRLLLVAILLSAFPAHADEPVTFQDTNFKLTVISALMTDGTLDFGFYPDFLKQIEGPNYDYEKDGYRLSTKAYQHFADFPLTDDQLAQIQRLTFDGGLDIYPYVYPFWGGETEDFDIRSLADIGHLPNLQEFEVISMLANPDLAPLKNAQRLRVLDLGLVNGSWKNLDALLDLPALKAITVFDTNLTTPDQLAILDQLARQGVAVSVY